MSEVLHSAPTAQAACDRLLDAALAAGGRDNITVLVARYSW
jgi:serine/threonine protein phosphatase PrpC